MSLVNALKERGNLAFKEGSFSSAKSLYAEALQNIDGRKRIEDTDEVLYVNYYTKYYQCTEEL